MLGVVTVRFVRFERWFGGCELDENEVRLFGIPMSVLGFGIVRWN